MRVWGFEGSRVRVQGRGSQKALVQKSRTFLLNRARTGRPRTRPRPHLAKPDLAITTFGQCCLTAFGHFFSTEFGQTEFGHIVWMGLRTVEGPKILVFFFLFHFHFRSFSLSVV